MPLALGYEVMLETAKIQCVEWASGYSLLSGQEVFLGEVQNVGTLLQGRARPTWVHLPESSELLLFAGPWSSSCSSGGPLANSHQVWLGKCHVSARFGVRKRGSAGSGEEVAALWPHCVSAELLLLASGLFVAFSVLIIFRLRPPEV